MNETQKPSDSPRDFLSKVEQLLAPVYAECFSTETLKTRNLLLIVSFVLILSAVGLIAFSKQPTGIPSIGISVTLTSGMRWVLLTLCGYLFVLHSTRSYMEWNLWRLRHQAPMMEISDLVELISSQWAERRSSINEEALSQIELFRKLNELRRDPLELVDAEKRLKDTIQEYQRLGDQLRTKQNALQSQEYENEAFKVNKMYEEFNRLSDEVDRLCKNHESKTAFERDALETRLHNAMETYSNEIDAPELKALKAKLDYLTEAIQPSKMILALRLMVEIFFPTFFAIAAMLIGFFAS